MNRTKHGINTQPNRGAYKIIKDRAATNELIRKVTIETKEWWPM